MTIFSKTLVFISVILMWSGHMITYDAVLQDKTGYFTFLQVIEQSGFQAANYLVPLMVLFFCWSNADFDYVMLVITGLVILALICAVITRKDEE